MEKEIAEKWVKTLRSGKYEQGEGALHEDGHYCCLGVLCDISNLSAWSGLNNSDYINVGDLLPETVRQWAEMNSSSGDNEIALTEDIEAVSESLVDKNDRGVSFEEIADFIEDNWKEL